MNNAALFQLKNVDQNKQDKFEGVRPGWTIKILQKIKEGEKTRTQSFRGIVIGRKHNKEAGGTITVRRTFGEVGVEKTYPVHLPTIDKVEIIKIAKTRKSKLYYLKSKSAKEVRKKTKNVKEASS